MERAHHVVAGGNLMVDVLYARAVRREQRNRMMDLVDPQQRRVADPVADPGIAYAGPEDLVAGRVSGAQSDVAESGDPCVAFAVIALAAGGRPPHQLDVVAGGILEGDEAPHPAQFCFLLRPKTD